MKLRLNSLVDGQQEIDEVLSAADLMVDNPPFNGAIEVTLRVDKEPQEIKISGVVKSVALFECDRCLEEFKQELEGSFTVLISQAIKPLQSSLEDDEDLISIAPNTNEVDLTTFIYDTLLLSVPMKKLCRPDCQGLCPVCGVNLNQGACQCLPAVGDERWAALSPRSNSITEE